MILDIVVDLSCWIVALFVIYCWGEYGRKKKWKQEKDAWYSLLVDASVEIRRLSGGDTALTEEIENVLRI